jgi:solute carrier family 25 phosphate transporter 3
MKQGWPPQHRRNVSEDTIVVCDSTPSSEDSECGTPIPIASPLDFVLRRRDEERCWSNFRILFGSLFSVCIFALYLTVEKTSHSRTDGTGSLRFSGHYFAMCVVAGSLSGLPHLIITPLDLVKCRIQTGEYSSLMQGVLLLSREAFCCRPGVTHISRAAHAISVVYIGWVPTMFGYCLQCALKFGFFEYFKFRLSSALPIEIVINYRLVILLPASGCAEFIADIALAPFEVVKVRLQSLPLSKRPSQLADMIPRMWMVEGIQGFYSCIVPLWFRQVPYTMVKFSAFEKLAALMFSFVVGSSVSDVEKSSWQIKSFIVILAGFGAGALCALVTQPADVIVSKISQRSSSSTRAMDVSGGKGCTMPRIVKEIGGWRGLFRGLLARIILFGTLSALQWAIYENFRSFVNMH